MKKTPIAQLIEHINENHAYFLEFGTTDSAVVSIMNKAKALLPEERENMEGVFEQSRLNNVIMGFKHLDFEQYFNENYEQ